MHLCLTLLPTKKHHHHPQQQLGEDAQDNEDEVDEEGEEEDVWRNLNLAQLRIWVEGMFPGKFSGSEGDKFLHHLLGWVHETAEEQLAMVTWLIDEKGADVNCLDGCGRISLEMAHSPELIGVLLDRGADPSPCTSTG